MSKDKELEKRIIRLRRLNGLFELKMTEEEFEAIRVLANGGFGINFEMTFSGHGEGTTYVSLTNMYDVCNPKLRNDD